MKRPAAALLGCITVLLLIAVAGVATIPSVPTGTWQPIGSMAVPRSGAAAVLLEDHRVLITGGNNGTDAVNSAEVFNADGSFANVSAMGTPRSGHIAVVLRDERVLVAGGVTAGGGATNSAEIYDPSSDAWTSVAGGMTAARSKATAVLLQDGRVLIAGGLNGNAPSSAVEIFDPNTEQFSFAGSLSSPRMGLASASLADGRVLITGGSNGNVPVATSDVFDPTTNTVSAGPAMTSPRVGHSATSLLDGRVLIAGGSNGSADLASAEVFDPAVGGFAALASNLALPRRDHTAILLPNNNAVQIVGGTSAGNEAATAEMFVPWTGAFVATGSPAITRQQAAMSALHQDGLLVMAGGSSAGTPVSSAELYGFATVKTDQADYAPGELVTITGSGWQPGETVTLTLVESPLLDTHPVMTAVADGQGHIANSSFSPDEHDFNVRFYLTAVGGQSGFQAMNTFTDNGNKSIFSDSNTASTTTAFGAISANQCRSSWLVAMQGGNLAVAPVPPPATANLSSTPAGATFFTGSVCSGSPVTSLSLGTTNTSAQFSFRIAAVGNYTIKGVGSWDSGGLGNDASATVTISQAASSVAASSATGTYGGTVTLSAVLSANGVGVSGKTIAFKLNAVSVGSATTDSTGTATLNSVSLTSPSKINAGTFASGVSASFAGDTSFAASSGTNTLTVNQQAITVTAATNSKTYDATTSAAATPTITSGGPLVTGDTANFSESYDNKNVATNKTLTPSGTVSDGNSGNNYSYTFVTNTTGAITTRSLTVTAATNTKTYDATTTAAATPTITTGALQGTDTANFTEAYANKNAGSNLTLIPSGTVSDGNSGNNYAVTFANNTTGVINKASLTLTAATNTKTYDATTSAAAIPTSSGLQGSDTVTSLTESYDTKNAGTGKTLSVDATYTVNDGNSGGNYTVTTQTNTTGVINKASLTPSITADDKDYDGANTATIHCTVAGVLAADTGNVTCSGTGTFVDANAGIGKTVTSSDLALSGPASGNYMLSTTTASTAATIRKVNATITVTPYNVTYDGDPHTATGTAKGVGGVDLSASLNLTGTTHTTAGTYTDTWTFTGGTNYIDATSTVSDVIAKADPVIAATGGTFTYDANPHGGTATATGVKGEALTPVNVAYTVVAAPPRNPGDLLASAPVNAGNYSVAARFAGDTNYNQKQSTTTAVVINKATPTVSVSFGSSPVTYDGNPHPATATVAGVGGADLTSGHGTVTVSYTPGPGAPVNAGSYTASAHFASSDGNYNDADSTVAASLTINKADPVVTAVGGTFTYDGNPHGGTATATGVNGEALTPVNVVYKDSLGALLATAPVNAGTYSVAARYLGDTNYNQKQSAAAPLVIDKAESTTAVTCPANVTYNGSAQTPCTATVTGAGGLNQALTPTYTNNVNAGTATASATYAGDANHNGSNDSKNFTIDKAASVTAVTCPTNVTYSGSAQEPCAATVTGAGGLNQSLNVSYSNNLNAGTATASASFGGDANHTNSSDSKNFTIDKADPLITATGGTFIYDGNPHGGSATAVGVKGEPLTPVNVVYKDSLGTLLATAPVNAGTYSVAARYLGDANYNQKQSAAAALVIDKADSATTLSCPASVTFDGTSQTPCTATVTGAGGLNQALTPTYTNNVNAGTATASATYAGDANHNGSSDSKNFTIEKAASVTTVICPASATYNGLAQTPCSASVTGAGSLNQALTPSYSNNVDAGTATASASFAGDANHTASSDSKNFTIEKAASVTTVTCPANVTYNGSAQTPCSATVTGAGGLSESLTVSYGNNTDAGTATASANYGGDANHTASSDSKSFTIEKAASVTTVICPTNVTYNGSAQEPCTAAVTGAGGLSLTPTPTYSNNTNAGTATASYSYAGDANHTASSDSKNFTIEKAASVTTVTCPTNVAFTGAALTPCSATVTGAGGLNLTPTPSYNNNVSAGTATASYNYAGDANHSGSSDSKNFTIDKASTATTLTCPTNVAFTGAALTPCSASVTGAGGLNQSLSVSYTNNLNAGTASASASYAGDANHDGSNDSKTFTIDKAASTTTVTCPASVNYNALPQTPCTATVAGAALSISPTPAYSNNANAGTATASYNYAGDLNHTASSDSKTFAINKAVLTVKADNKSMLLHAALPAFTASYSGFKGSDSFANSVTGAPSLTASATSASPVGAYAIAAAPGTLAANNYSFAFMSGTLTISYSMSACLGDVGHTILQPINADGSSVFNGKSTSPAKFRVCDASGASIGTAGVVQSFVLYQTIQGTVTSTVNEPVDSTTPDLNFRFDPSAQQWIFNINNKALSPNRTYIFLITLNDQSTIPFQYGLR